LPLSQERFKIAILVYCDSGGFVFLLHKVMFIVSLVDWCARIRLHVRISLLERDSSTGSTLLSAWGATSNQWNIQMSRLRLVGDINNVKELIWSQPVRPINAYNSGNRFCLQHLVSVPKLIAEW